MRIKLDENLPTEIARRLATRGHDVHTMQDEGLAGCSDADLWSAVQRDRRSLLTQDLDFSDARRFVPGSHNGVILLRLRTPSQRQLLERVEQVFDDEQTNSWKGCFVIVTDRKVRIRRPQ
jgi:predicted nuclease of predicted toxin-antitoxin system